MIGAALAQLPGDRRRGKSVLVRIDGAGSTHKVIEWLTRRRLSYSVGFTLPENTPDLLRLIPEHVWTPAYDAVDDVRDGARSRLIIEDHAAAVTHHVPGLDPGAVEWWPCTCARRVGRTRMVRW